MSSARLNETTRPQQTSVPFSAIPQLPWRQRPGATSRRSNYNDERSQILHFKSKGPDSPVDFDSTVSQSNVSSLSVSTTTSYTHAALPPTASPDLVAATVSLTDPRHMEVIYDADRKRQFQALVRRYMNQLLHGCDREGFCTVPTCWTARKRLAGSGGTVGVGQGRKFTVLSARIMACTLACRDNPYEGLCDGEPVEVGLAVKDTKEVGVGHGGLQTPSGSSTRNVEGGEATGGGKDDREGLTRAKEKEDSAVVVKQKRVDAGGKSGDKEGSKFRKGSVDSGAKDTKSFAQVLFDTRSLKMLEWLSIPPPITNFRFSSAPTPQDKDKDAFAQGEGKDLRDSVGTPTSDIGSGKGELVEEATTEDPNLSQNSLGERSNTLMFPDIPTRSPTSPSQAAHKRRETLHEIVTPTPHSNQRRAVTPQDPPQTPIAPPPIHLPQRGHRRERPTYEPPRAHYHQSQFTEHFYGIPSPQQTPSRASSRQLDYENPFGCLTPTDSSRVNTPDMDTGSLDTQLTTPPPQTLSHLDIGLILSLVKLCIEGEMPVARHTEADTFARQSMFYCLSNPDALMRCFGGVTKGKSTDFPDAYDMDPLTTDKAFRLMAWKWENTVLKSLWKGLEEVYKYRATSLGKAASGGSTIMLNKSLKEDAPTGARQHLLDDYAATYIIIVSMHALAAMLPRRGSYLPREHAREEEWLAMGMVRSRGLVTVEIGDCFENELAERLMKRVLRALDYRIAQAARGLSKGEENPVERLLMQYLRKCVAVEVEALTSEERLEGTFGASKERVIRNWSVAGCMLEWARSVLLKNWDGNEEVKKESVTGGALTLIKLLYDNRRPLHLESGIFATPMLSDRLDPKEVPVTWYQSLKDSHDSETPGASIHLISHPFLFTPFTLVTYFRAINLSIMTSYYESALSTLSLMRQVCLNQYFPVTKEQRDKFVEDKLKIACTTYLLMGIRREHILKDAFNGVYKREIRELMKPLKIKFLDSFEEGVDQGGPQIEFFDVLTKEVMRQGYGMFVDTDNVNHVSWFTVKPLEELHKFELLGVLMGIAIYNGITLPVNFPLIFYKKLLGGEADGLEDIEDGWPELVKGLRKMLEWEEGDVEDVFCRTYEFAYETVDGQRGSVDMVKAKKMGWQKIEDVQNGVVQMDIHAGKERRQAINPEDNLWTEPDMVTNANRHEYVADYIAWLTNYSISPQFTAFRRGMLSILPNDPLTLLFTPVTLKSLFEGSPTIDTHALESITKYDDGYHVNHPLIREFWSVVHEYCEAQKGALLEFVTASDRLPGGGVGDQGGQGAITFVIQRVGPSENLPTSMTCFGRLLLPEYEVGKGKVKEKLEKALENSRGFGII
ncbi:hypothetical protein BGX38DRAFT_1268682 [Terfezia claveryi]|nr:hypothetical protein BGX38DRAFT_1268682 [Terfezia claveryi]